MNEVAQAFMSSSQHQLDHARRNINHCFDQLGTDDLWWTPRAGCNPIGVIIQHLRAIFANGRSPASAASPTSATVPPSSACPDASTRPILQAQFNRVLDRVAEVYSTLDAAEILDGKRIQGFDTTVLDAIYDTMCHLKLHTGQVLYLTRMRLGEAYREFWSPATAEQGT